MFEDVNDVPPPAKQEDWDAVLAEKDPEKKTEDAPAPVAADPIVEPVVAVVDPYSGLSPDLKAKLERFDVLIEEHPKLVQQLQETRGRVSALQSEFAKRPLPAAAAPDQTAIAAAAKDPEKWEELKKDFPEWGEGIQAFVEARIGALGKTGMSTETSCRTCLTL